MQKHKKGKMTDYNMSRKNLGRYLQWRVGALVPCFLEKGRLKNWQITRLVNWLLLVGDKRKRNHYSKTDADEQRKEVIGCSVG